MTQAVATGEPADVDVPALLAQARAASHGSAQLSILERVHDALRDRLVVASRE